MHKGLKNIIVIVCFFGILAGFLAANLLLPDAQFSASERRKLAQLPKFSAERLFSGELFEKFDQYALDQFILRDGFRGLKAFSVYYLFRQKDNNGLYFADGRISKMIYKLNERSVLRAAKKLNELNDRYFVGMNVYYSVIPDKNHYAAPASGHLSLDIEKMAGLLQDNLPAMQFIDLVDTLELQDYYKTDIHWRQEKIIDTANELFKGMNNNARVNQSNFEIKALYPFYGSYYGQAALPQEPDTLNYLTDAITERAIVFDFEQNAVMKVYAPEKFNGMDPYDVFLSGAKPLLEITDPQSASDKELILFRDSFGSSIAPLLLSGYKKVILVDLRYISTKLLPDYIDFSVDRDVLFLYSPEVLNNSAMLK